MDRLRKIEDLIESFQTLKSPRAFKGFAKVLHVTPSQWMVLRVIEGRDACTVKDVAQALGMTSSAATQLVDGLVRGRFVARKANKDDRRKVTLTLAPKTVTDIGRMKKHMMRHMHEVFKVLTDKEFDELYRLNKKVSDSLTQ